MGTPKAAQPAGLAPPLPTPFFRTAPPRIPPEKPPSKEAAAPDGLRRNCCAPQLLPTADPTAGLTAAPEGPATPPTTPILSGRWIRPPSGLVERGRRRAPGVLRSPAGARGNSPAGLNKEAAAPELNKDAPDGTRRSCSSPQLPPADPTAGIPAPEETPPAQPTPISGRWIRPPSGLLERGRRRRALGGLRRSSPGASGGAANPPEGDGRTGLNSAGAGGETIPTRCRRGVVVLAEGGDVTDVPVSS